MIIFIIPVYNEEENIGLLFKKTKQKMEEAGFDYKLIIINDGSSDGTADVIESFKKEMPVHLHSYYPNKGVGEAFRQGFHLAIDMSKDEDIIVTKEADNTSDLSILDKLIDGVRQGYDLVLASCYAKEGRVRGTTLYRLFLSRTANTILKLFLGVGNVHTYSSFYRAYSAKALKELYSIYGDDLIHSSGFECMVELLIKFNRDGRFKIKEVPMVLDGSRRSGKSKMRILKTIQGFLKVIFNQGYFKK